MTQQTPSGEPFEGRIGRTIAESTPWWPAPRLKAGAPDVVLVVLDDTDFAHLGFPGRIREVVFEVPAATPPGEVRATVRSEMVRQ